MYKQLVQPNLDPYITEGGVVLNDWLGWCLAYAKTAFGASGGGYTAWEAWNNASGKHTDALPTGVYVPIWFSGYGGMGHVAIYKDGKIWSSPYTHKPYTDVLNSIADVERIYGVKYVGWSEYIGNKKVVEQGDEMLTRQKIIDTYLVIRGSAPSEQEINAHLNGGTMESLVNGFKREMDANRAANSKTISDLQTALKNEQNKPPKEVIKEVEKIVTKVETVEKPYTPEGVWAWFVDKIKKVFK